MNNQVALTFEDGVTRFVDCKPGDKVVDASYRARINLPMDCRDGVCGTCKAFCESGTYEPGDYIDEALTDDEAEEGFCLPCVMVPTSDLVLRIPATSDVAKTGASSFTATLADITTVSETTTQFSIQLEDRASLSFLPGQYVNIVIPGTDQTRSYSFSSSPVADGVEFLLRNTPTGALATYLRSRAKVGDTLELKGPLGSFYLREVNRPVVFLAGGTGLAPFLSMLGKMSAAGGIDHPVHLIYGVNGDEDLVGLDDLEGYAKQLPDFTYTCTIADESGKHPNKGFVTHHLEARHLHGGDVDMYLCGPPPMVDAVRAHLTAQGITPMNFYFEKFTSTGVVTQIGEEHLHVGDSDEAFDARMALELGAAELAIGKLDAGQITHYRALAEATAPHIKDGHFVDVDAFRTTNTQFHTYLVESTGNATLLDAFKRLSVQEYMGQALTPTTDVSDDIITDHRELVAACEAGDIDAARRIIIAHANRSKEAMRAGIANKGGPG